MSGGNAKGMRAPVHTSLSLAPAPEPLNHAQRRALLVLAQRAPGVVVTGSTFLALEALGLVLLTRGRDGLDQWALTEDGHMQVEKLVRAAQDLQGAAHDYAESKGRL